MVSVEFFLFMVCTTAHFSARNNPSAGRDKKEGGCVFDSLQIPKAINAL